MSNRWALADQAQRIADDLRSSVVEESDLQGAWERARQLAADIKDARDEAASEQAEEVRV